MAEIPSTIPDTPSNDNPLGKPANPSGYQLSDVLGEGGMGVVYRALEISSGRSVAIKFARSTGLVRFRREFRELKQLHHAHIVKVLDFNPDFAPPYLVMEYLNGEPLKRYYCTYPERRLPYSVGIPLFIQLADALAYLHSKGILHRDLKPANLMVLSDQQRPFIKLMDFGLVRPHETANRITVRGQILGTPEYMSPEQFYDASTLTPQSDLYSLGVIMYEVFTGQRPFDGDFNALREKHKTHPLAWPSEQTHGISSTLRNLITRLLAKDPAQRPESADVVQFILSQITPPEKTPSNTPKSISQLTPGIWLNHNRYQIREKLGEGGFGLVAKAWDAFLDIPVAIKINQRPSLEAENQFKNEAQLLARLRHPSLPHVTNHFIESIGQCLVMDFIDGHNLTKVLEIAQRQYQGPIPEKSALIWVGQICDALSYLHKQGITHRDIKPNNIIIRVVPD